MLYCNKLINMQRIISTLTFLLGSLVLFAQMPNSFNYQAVIKGEYHELVIDQDVAVKLTLLQGDVNGKSVYSEKFVKRTTRNGLVNLKIGQGLSSDSFESIDWSNGPYFIQTAIDLSGGSSFDVMGTSQLLSVPYALHSKTAERLMKPNSNNYFIGQDTLGGIVFSLYSDKNGVSHGLIVSKSEVISTWQNTHTITNANNRWNGHSNTKLMSNSDAASFALTLGRGWYIPSIEELKLLWANSYYINKALKDENQFMQMIKTGSNYLSSTEYDSFRAMSFNFETGYQSAMLKKYKGYVRAIRSF